MWRGSQPSDRPIACVPSPPFAEIAFPEPKSPELQDILHAFLEKDPAERISLEDASEHVWFMKMQLKKAHDEVSGRYGTQL